MRTNKKSGKKTRMCISLTVAALLVVVLVVASVAGVGVGSVAAQETGEDGGANDIGDTTSADDIVVLEDETVQRVAFDYGDFGGNLNLEVNGSRVSDISSFAQSPPNGVDGSTIGGASVSVQTTSGTTGEVGHVEITGNISSFSVGGQELWIDNVEFGPASNPSANVTFDNPTPSQPRYALADKFTDSGVDMNVTPFIFADGTSCTAQSICGFGEQDSSTPAQSGGNAPDFRPDNVNLDFNISSVVATQPSVSASGDTASLGGQATVTVDSEDVGSISVSNIPNSWSVASSQDDGAQLIGSPSQGLIWSWAASGVQSSVSVSVTFDIPSNAQTGTSTDLEVTASSPEGDAMDTATVTIEDCPVEPVVCNYDPNGNIGTAELQDAINDFVQGSIGPGDLQAVINAFISSS